MCACHAEHCEASPNIQMSRIRSTWQGMMCTCHAEHCEASPNIQMSHVRST